ncbi:hypothetical protein QTP88_022373 [Uroleucon formosanum]
MWVKWNRTQFIYFGIGGVGLKPKCLRVSVLLVSSVSKSVNHTKTSATVVVTHMSFTTCSVVRCYASVSFSTIRAAGAACQKHRVNFDLWLQLHNNMVDG